MLTLPWFSKTDVQLSRGIDVVKVKMGLLPKSTLDGLGKTAKAYEKAKAEAAK